MIGNVQNHLKACVYSQVASVCYSRLFVGSSGKFFQERFKQRSASEGPRTQGRKVTPWSCLPHKNRGRPERFCHASDVGREEWPGNGASVCQGLIPRPPHSCEIIAGKEASVY